MTRPIVSDFWNRPCISQDTKASHWFDAKCEGRRLPEHELPDVTSCDLCGALCDPDPAVRETAGYDICPQCLEDML